MFSLKGDVRNAFIMFNRVSVQVVLVTMVIAGVVIYKYLRNQLAWEKNMHSAELFRHNWFVEQAKIEEKMGIVAENQHHDCSLGDLNIIDMNEINKESSGEETGGIPILKARPVTVGLLPRDKFAAFTNLVRIHKGFYVLLSLSMVIIWSLLTCMFVARMSSTNRIVFTEDNYPAVQILEVLRAHKRVMITSYELHKCYGTIDEINVGMSMAGLISVRILNSERNVGESVVAVIDSILMMAILFEFAYNALYLSIYEYPSGSKKHIYFYGTALRFLQSFFLFSTSAAGTLLFEFRFRTI